MRELSGGIERKRDIPGEERACPNSFEQQLGAFGHQGEGQTLMESLILAQDKRWRRA